MNKATKVTLITIGILLMLNGVINVIDDGTILAYDIASILSGIGFIVVSFSKKA